MQGQPHCALHFYRKAVEVDYACHSALYQSALVFRHLGNSKAEIEALHLLYSVSHSANNFLGLLFLIYYLQYFVLIYAMYLVLYIMYERCIYTKSLTACDISDKKILIDVLTLH